MIDINELRIGNHIEFLKPNGKWLLKVITPHSFPEIMSEPENYRPIPLTEEVLLKCGFEFDEYGYTHFDTRTLFNKYTVDGVLHFLIGNVSLDNMKYLHQLQNLYYHLTQKELNIEL